MRVPKKLRVERLDKGYRDIRDNRGNRVSAPPLNLPLTFGLPRKKNRF